MASSVPNARVEPRDRIYPGFGTPILVSRKETLADRVKALAVVTLNLAIISSFTAGGALLFTANPTLGVLAGFAVGAGIVLIAKQALGRYRRSDVICSKALLSPSVLSKVDPLVPRLGEASPTNLVVSNEVDQTFAWKLKLIESAKQSVEISFNFAGGKDLRAVLDRLLERHSTIPGFTTHLMISRDMLEDADIAQLKSLKKLFGDQFNYIVTDRLYYLGEFSRSEENHVKLLVTDGRYFVMGGSGVQEKMTRTQYSGDELPQGIQDSLVDRAFRDSDIVGQGPVAQTMRLQFYRLYQVWAQRMERELKGKEGQMLPLQGDAGVCKDFHENPKLIRGATVRYIVGGPEHRNQNPITEVIAEAITNAKKEVRIANMLFNPAPQIKEALLSLRSAKAKVTGYFNGTGEDISISHHFYQVQNKFNYDLIDDGYEYQTPDILYHKKLSTIDGKITIIGSYNLGQKSAFCDYENICLIEDERVTEKMNSGLDMDSKNSKRVQNECGRHASLRPSKPLGAAAILWLGSYCG